MTINQEFFKWAKERNKDLLYKYDNLKTGQKVNFTNDYGVTFKNHKILAFDKVKFNNRFIYLDIDCYWFPVKLENITLI